MSGTVFDGVFTTDFLHLESIPVPVILSLEKHCTDMKFSELVRLLEKNGFRLIKEKGSIRYYGKIGLAGLIRVDFHGSKEIPTGTCSKILKDSGLKGGLQ